MSKVYIDIPIVDLMPNQSINQIEEYSYDEAKKIISKLYPDFNENLYTFEYLFTCRVNIKKINNDISNSTDISNNIS